jgi:hypothetical protein
LKDCVGRNLKTDGLNQKSILAFFKADGSTLDFGNMPLNIDIEAKVLVKISRQSLIHSRNEQI